MLQCIWYFRQRQEFGASGGRLHIWGQPAKFIAASYCPAAAGNKAGTGIARDCGKSQDRHTRTSLLLLSGWWGLAR